MNRKPKRILLIVVLLVALLGLAGGVYFGTYSRATPEAAALLQGSDAVEVKAMDKGWLLDGPGTEAALVFYPGGKVEATAYLPLLTALAEDGVDCFLVKMPLNMAFMDLNAAAAVQADYAYDRWYIGGHSLGGAMAAVYAAEHGEGLSGLILTGTSWSRAGSTCPPPPLRRSCLGATTPSSGTTAPRRATAPPPSPGRSRPAGRWTGSKG